MKTEERRQQILHLLGQGKSLNECARLLQCSKALVIKTKRTSKPQDARARNGRPRTFTDAITRLILDIHHKQRIGAGLLFHTLMRDRQLYNLSAADIPSRATIGRILAGMASQDENA